MTQYSLFGAAAAEPDAVDLDGLVLAGAQWVRTAAKRAASDPAARLSIVVADRWRAEALAASYAGLGLLGGAPGAGDAVAAAVVVAEGGFAARTAFVPELSAHAARWTRGARTGLPPSFELTAGGLRLWAVAAGHRDDAGYLLGTALASNSQPDDTIHRAAGAQLSRLGVAALSLSRRGTGWGTGWRITSLRRLRRLAELLGPPPPGGEHEWPTSVHPRATR